MFSKVIAETVSNFPGDRTLIVSNAIDERHTFLREDIKYFQFECRAANYPLREQLESESFVMRAIDHNWNQGAGVNLSVCGYSIRQSVLMQLRHVAYLEVYKLTAPDCFTTDSITFPGNLSNSDKLVPPLVRQLSMYSGCPFSTMEILWKYYRSLSTAKERRLKYVTSCLKNLTKGKI